MAIEIERKFLVIDDSWRNEVRKKFQIKQGYLNTSIERSVRVRIKSDKGFLTIKGITKGITRIEHEYEIPLNEAEELLNLCDTPIIEKIRHEVSFENQLWEIDEFYGKNAGLIIAELELESEHQPYNTPDWIGDEVSDDAKYYNLSLIKKPFSTWQ